MFGASSQEECLDKGEQVTRDVRYACPTVHVGLSFCNLATLASFYGFISAGGYSTPSKNCPNRIFSVQGFSRTSLRGVGVSGEWSSARGWSSATWASE